MRIVTDEEISGQLAPKVRNVLALLLLRANQVVPTDALIEELWPDGPPASAVATTQTYVYRLRKVLASARAGRGEELRTLAPGYLLTVAADQVDAGAFERLTERGRLLLAAGRPDEAAAVLRQSLALWSGPALADVATGPLLSSHVTHLEESRIRALELRIEADLRLGLHRGLIGELRSLASAYSLNEWFHGTLIAALNRSGRRGEALKAYQDLRVLLRDELGVEPCAQVQRLLHDTLTGEGVEAGAGTWSVGAIRDAS
jgi:DNA-binding SARP family transcriptional activator